MYTWDKIVILLMQLLLAAIFLLNNVTGAMLNKNVGWFLSIVLFYILQSVIKYDVFQQNESMELFIDNRHITYH